MREAGNGGNAGVPFLLCSAQSNGVTVAATMKNLRVFLLVCLCAGGSGLCASAQAISAKTLAGDWAGSIAGQLPLVLHVRASAGGALTAVLDSPSQNANGLAGTDVVLTGSTLTFSVPIVHGSYTGTVSADGKFISGTWTQGQSMPLEFRQTKSAAQVAAEEAGVKPSSVDGNWAGTLNAGGTTLRVVFHFRTVPGGAIRCSMDSLDQNAMGIPCGDAKLDANKLSVDAAAIHGTYDGTLRADHRHIDGTWSQGTPLPLVLTKQ